MTILNKNRNILLIGNEQRIAELQIKLDSSIKHQCWINDWKQLASANLIIDLNFDDEPSRLTTYAPLKNIPILVSAVKISLAHTIFNCTQAVDCQLIGLNALPTFINRSKWEVSLYDEEYKALAQQILADLGVEYAFVKDRVGMVTPRIVCMIINEACFTLQEGTADIADIDLAMKLGTRYPYGPFEWADKIGIRQVYETLQAIYENTRDERYKICPLLKSYYWKGKKFYE